jgi:hypothetical protein
MFDLNDKSVINILYSGAFVSCGWELVDEIKRSIPGRIELDNVISDLHVIFQFKPSSIDQSLLGENIDIAVIGYANDGKNEAVKVVCKAVNPIIQKMIDGITVQHITLSIAKGELPKNSAMLEFEDIIPIHISGKFGIMYTGAMCTSITEEN